MKRVCPLPGKHATGIQKGEPMECYEKSLLAREACDRDTEGRAYSVLALFTNPAMIFQKLWSVMKRVCTLPGKHATGIQKGSLLNLGCLHIPQ